MKCPYCGYEDDKVIDSRMADGGTVIRRRRVCLKCNERFNTYERIETISIIVIKKDNSRQEYKREKIMSGIMRACVKRPIRYDDMDAMVSKVEAEIIRLGLKEIQSTRIGDMVLERLKDIDEVAYVRFASVYKRFDDINSFVEELEKFKKDK